MSLSIRISPQASKVLAAEARSSAGDAAVVRLRIHSRPHTSPRRITCKVMPLRDERDIPVIINMIHDSGGARAPMLLAEGTIGGP
jgi:hypothetical protein